jgi:hypothetical protein
MPHLRRHVNDGAWFVRFDKPASNRLRHEISGAYVDAEHEVEVLRRHINEWRWPIGAGIVDDDVEWRLRSDDLLRRINVAYVEGQRIRQLTACPN